MANEEHLQILKQGVEQWNKWRTENAIIPDLSGAELSGANLREANLREANLSGAYLSDANLVKADLSEANLSDAKLGRASLSAGSLRGANLSGAYLGAAELLGDADLRDANLRGANLSGAKLYEADLKDADLSKALLGGADLSDACLNDAKLVEAYLSEANLRSAYLSGANLRGADLSEADLSDANLSDAKLGRARLSDANLRGANLSGVDLTDADLSRTNLVETNFTNATISGCRIYGASAWDLILVDAAQRNLIITKEGEPVVTVDDLEVGQFIYLLLNHEKLRNTINSVAERGVLLLGRFGGGGLEVLRAVAAELRNAKYLPIIFDFDRPRDRNYTETVKTLVGLSRFVIVDMSGPSVPQELYATVPHFKIPFIPIVEEGRPVYAMFADLLEYPWVLRPELRFANTDELLAMLPTRVIAPAEAMHEQRQCLLTELFGRLG